MAFRDADHYAGFHTGPTAGSFEVFWDDGNEEPELFPAPGWYWWACLPGCLPDGDPDGPFDTSSAAYNEALELEEGFDPLTAH